MKIASYNVNGINARLPVLLRWLEESKPDIVCLQELKCLDENLPIRELEDAGYHGVWHGQKSWNGVAILTRGSIIQEVRHTLPGDSDDIQSRYIEAVVNGVLVCCLYLPNGNPAPGEKFEYKLRWMERLYAHATYLLSEQIPVVLAGDFNVIPAELDVYKPQNWVTDALFLPESREAFHKLIDRGWTDALRKLYPEETIYTFWDYFRDAYSRNAGLRIDHFLLNKKLLARLEDGGVDREVRGWEKSSDHAPVWIEISDPLHADIQKLLSKKGDE
jgi:exodeoxyribonuclease III